MEEEKPVAFLNNIRFLKIDPENYNGTENKVFVVSQNHWEWDHFWKTFYDCYWYLGFVTYIIVCILNIKS